MSKRGESGLWLKVGYTGNSNWQLRLVVYSIIAFRGIVTPRRACGFIGGPIARRMRKICYGGYRFRRNHSASDMALPPFTLSLRDVEDFWPNAEWRCLT